MSCHREGSRGSGLSGVVEKDPYVGLRSWSSWTPESFIFGHRVSGQLFLPKILPTGCPYRRGLCLSKVIKSK